MSSPRIIFVVGSALLAAAPGCSEEPPPPPELSFWSGSQRVQSIREGQPFVVRFTGAPPRARVTLRSRFRSYEGWATYLADGQGRVDVGRDPAVDGTYSGIDPDGLVWSMRTESSEQDGPLDIQFRAEVEGAPALEATLVREPVEQALLQRRVDEEGLVGILYSPQGRGPLPAVLVLGGSEGGLSLSSRRAAHLAAAGFTTLALAYFGVDPLPPVLAEIPLEYFRRGLSWLARQPEVQPGRLAVFGVSRSSEIALQLGATFDDVRAVIADVPSHVRWNGFAREPKAAWTYQGAALPYLGYGAGANPDAPITPPPPEQLPNGLPGIRLAWGFEQSYRHAPAEEVAAATIELERTQGPILLIGAGDDGVWPSCLFADAAMARLRSSGHADRHPDESVCYADAGHLIGPPGAPTTDLYAVPYEGIGAFVFGGKPGPHARAQRESHARIQRFLEAALR
jgi:hypothetical protein